MPFSSDPVIYRAQLADKASGLAQIGRNGNLPGYTMDATDTFQRCANELRKPVANSRFQIIVLNALLVLMRINYRFSGAREVIDIIEEELRK